MMTTHDRSDATPRRGTSLIAVLAALAIAGCAGGAPGSSGRDAVASAEPPDAVLASPSAVTPSATAVYASPRAVARQSAPPVPPSNATPTPSPKPYALNLYRRGDYVAQYTFEWCVGASLQMAINMATSETVTSRANQKMLWEMAQARSSSPFGGANPRGWTAALNDLGVGPYELVSIPTFDGALRVAARAIRETKRPVGLVMWRGRHAWVMSGFESVGDPAIHDDIRVTGVRVLDPLYPNGSKVWGPSPKPNALVKPATLAEQFVIRDHGRVDLGVAPGWLIVLPKVATVDETDDREG
jgi:hypothetical protein